MPEYAETAAINGLGFVPESPQLALNRANERTAARLAADAELFERGSIAIGNGFMLVEDATPSDTHNGFTPIPRYNRALTERKIIMTPRGYTYRTHDTTHAVDFMQDFEHAEYANVVCEAARYADGDEARSKAVVDGFDKFSDAARDMRLRPYGFIEDDIVPYAKEKLGVLVAMAHHEELSPEETTVIVERIFDGLDLRQYESMTRSALVLAASASAIKLS